MSVINIVTKPVGRTAASGTAARADSISLLMNPIGTILNRFSAQQPIACLRSGPFVLELDLAEPSERVPNVCRVHDRQPSHARTVHVGKRAIREPLPFGSAQLGHVPSVVT